MVDDTSKETLDKWLARLLTSGLCPGLEMVDHEQRIFRIPWRNEKCGGLQDDENDTKFLRLWAEHKKYKITDGGRKERRGWKEKFRNALNKCKDRVTKLQDDKQGSLLCQFKDGLLPVASETRLSLCKRKAELDTFAYEENSGVKKIQTDMVDQVMLTSDMTMSNARCPEMFAYVPSFKQSVRTTQNTHSLNQSILADHLCSYESPDENVPHLRIPLTPGENVNTSGELSVMGDEVPHLSQSAEDGAPPYRETMATDENVPPLVQTMTADKNALLFRTQMPADENLPLNSSIITKTDIPCNQSMTVDCNGDLTVSIEVMYDQQKVAAGNVNSRFPNCRIFSDSCVIPEALKEKFKCSEGGIELKLPQVDLFPHIEGEIKEKICDVLESMERGLILKYDSNSKTIFVERNCSIRCFLFDGISRSEAVPRRKIRKENPILIKAFDFLEFIESVSSHMTKKTPRPRPYIIITIGHEADPSVVHNPLLQVPVFIKITHKLADKFLHMALACAEPNVNPMFSGFNSLDNALHFFKDTESSSNSERHLCEIILQNIERANQACSELNVDNSILSRDYNATDQQLTAKPFNDPNRSLHVFPVVDGRQTGGVLQVTISYGVPHKEVKSKTINTGTCCRIIPPHANLSVLKFFEGTGDVFDNVVLPHVNDVGGLLADSQTNLTKIFKNMTSGVIIQQESGCIFVERRCTVKVFSTDGRTTSKPLPRERGQVRKFEKVFDYQQFLAELRAHVENKNNPCPKDGVILTVGNEINPVDEDFPLRKVLVYISITDIRSKRAIQEATGQCSEAKYSLMDSYDGLCKFFKDLNLKT